ncbi:sporulation protein [Actinomadura rubteroloni]|uniref:Sporulation protein n=1 Tax=Actinomadura rubteroloni TaxID=1926885 RepID=A0A2P4UEW6_9ACTN|nr:hypothetical protein [Actinomadura rubteroloni]POM23576.1 sporulation protein [Actinomadura rubteroloni]
MARRKNNERLSALLEEAQWSAADLARTVNALGRAQGIPLRYDRTSVAHWLTGSRPRPPVPDLAAAAFSRRTGRVVLPFETGLTSEPPVLRIAVGERPGTSPRPLAELVELCRADADPARRQHLLRGAHRVLPPPAPLWQPPSGQSAEERRGDADSLAVAGVSTLQKAVVTVSECFEHHGGAYARSALAQYVADDASSILHRAAGHPLERRMLTLVAELTGLLGRMTADAGHAHLAQRYSERALKLAHEAGDRHTYSVLLRSMSVQDLRLGQPRNALRLAEAAITVAAGRADIVKPDTLTFLLSQRAVIFARLGEPGSALADLDSAWTSHTDRVRGKRDPFEVYPRAALEYQQAEVQRVLGNPSEAARHLAASLRDRPPGHVRARALTLAKLAEVHLSAGHLDAACERWDQFLDLCPHLRSVEAAQALARMGQSLRPHRRYPQARLLLERAVAIRSSLR